MSSIHDSLLKRWSYTIRFFLLKDFILLLRLLELSPPEWQEQMDLILKGLITARKCVASSHLRTGDSYSSVETSTHSRSDLQTRLMTIRFSVKTFKQKLYVQDVLVSG